MRMLFEVMKNINETDQNLSIKRNREVREEVYSIVYNRSRIVSLTIVLDIADEHQYVVDLSRWKRRSNNDNDSSRRAMWIRRWSIEKEIDSKQSNNINQLYLKRETCKYSSSSFFDNLSFITRSDYESRQRILCKWECCYYHSFLMTLLCAWCCHVVRTSWDDRQASRISSSFYVMRLTVIRFELVVQYSFAHAVDLSHS